MNTDSNTGGFDNAKTSMGALEQPSRRGFLKASGGAAAAALLGGCGTYSVELRSPIVRSPIVVDKIKAPVAEAPAAGATPAPAPVPSAPRMAAPAPSVSRPPEPVNCVPVGKAEPEPDGIVQGEISLNDPSKVNYLTLMKVLQRESRGGQVTVNPNNPKVAGVLQFDEKTAELVGLKNRNDPYESIMAGGRLQIYNRDRMTRSLGYVPAEHLVAMAHEQGIGGALVLIKNPNMKAVDALATLKKAYSPASARLAIVNNGGTADMTSAEFIAYHKKSYDERDVSRSIAFTKDVFSAKGVNAPDELSKIVGSTVLASIKPAVEERYLANLRSLFREDPKTFTESNLMGRLFGRGWADGLKSSNGCPPGTVPGR